MRINRRMLLGTAVASICSGLVPRAFSRENWPSRPVKIISPYGVGGPNDLSARMIGDYLARHLGQAFIIENKTGAGTRVGNSFVAHAPSDGYTILYAAAPYATLEALYGQLQYDPQKDLQPVAMAAVAPLFLVVNAKTPIGSVKDLISYGKAQAKGLTFGSPGYGSLPHLASELLFRNAKVKGLTVQYRGDVAAYTDLLAGGRIDATLTAITAALPHIRNGSLRVLGVASAAPSAIYPEAAPLSEQGLPDVVASGWYGFMAPAAVPADIVKRLDEQINRALSEPVIQQKLSAQGLEARQGSAAQFGDFIKAETRKWSEVIKAAGIKGV